MIGQMERQTDRQAKGDRAVAVERGEEESPERGEVVAVDRSGSGEKCDGAVDLPWVPGER